MKLADYLQNRLAEKLRQHRILVWYDGERAFSGFVAALDLPECNTISAQSSALAARRQAETLYARLNAPDASHDVRNASLLIYVPRVRRVGEERILDPFEVFAAAGEAFGDEEAEQLKSLALQALPEFADQVERLFREGRPTLELLDGLENAPTYPLVNQALGTRSAVEAAVLLLGDSQAVARLQAVLGCETELRGLLQQELGGAWPASAKDWPLRRTGLARYILFSEFVFDLPIPLPPALANLPCAAELLRPRIYTIAERLRETSGYREAYLELAAQVEKDLALPAAFPGEHRFGRRDTFAFEERSHLAALARTLEEEDLSAARELLENRRRSVWRQLPERALLWAVAERCVNLLEIAGRVEDAWKKDAGSLRAMVAAYTREQGWSDLDRAQRLLEQSLAEFTGQDELEALILRCRACYRQVLQEVQNRFLELVEKDGWPVDGFQRQSQVFDRFVAPALASREKVAYILSDSLRYEMGRDLAQALADLGSVEIQPASAALPTVTVVGMAALMPGADGMLALKDMEGALVPALGDRPLKDVNARLELLREKFGDRLGEVEISKFLSQTSQQKQAALVGKAELLVVRDSRIDSFGENVPLHDARRYMSDMLGDLKAAANQLVRLGFGRLIIAADHGHLLLPEILPGDVLSQPPAGEWALSKRRVRLGQQVREGPGTRLFDARRLGIQGDIADLAMPDGLGVYGDGSGYLHGGLSLQEAVIPVIVLKAAPRPSDLGSTGNVFEIRYAKKSFTSSAIGLKVFYNSLLTPQMRVRVEAFDGPGANANKVGEPAECDARDEITHEIILQAGQETPVPLLLERDFRGPFVEVRVTNPDAPVVWARLTLQNGMLD